MVVFYIEWLYPKKILSIYRQQKGGENLNFLEHMHKLGIKGQFFCFCKVIIENLQAHIHIKGPNNSTCNHV